MVGSYRWVLFALIAFVAQASFAGPLYPNVVVTTEVLKPLVDDILKGMTQSTSLLAANQDPHTSAMRPSQVQILHQADVIIAPDQHLSPGLSDALTKARKRGAVVVYLTELEGAEPLRYRRINPWLGVYGKERKTFDPHLWLDPLRMANILPEIATAIGQYSPEHEARMQRNALRVARHLRAVTFPGVRNYLTSTHTDPNHIAYISAHDAYHYFEDRFALPSSGFFYQVPEEYVGARTTTELLQKAKKTSARCVFAEAPNKRIEKLARVLQARVVLLSPERLPARADVPPANWYANDYDRLLMAIAHQFSRCMR